MIFDENVDDYDDNDKNLHSNPNSWNTWFLMLLLRHKIIRAYKITVSLSLDRLQLSDFSKQSVFFKSELAEYYPAYASS